MNSRVPRPVGDLEVLEDDPCFTVLLGRVAPDVKVAVGTTRRRPASPLEPWMLVGSVVQYQLGDDAQVASMRLAEEDLQLAQCPVSGIDVGVISNVVAVVFERRGIEGQEPD